MKLHRLSSFNIHILRAKVNRSQSKLSKKITKRDLLSGFVVQNANPTTQIRILNRYDELNDQKELKFQEVIVNLPSQCNILVQKLLQKVQKQGEQKIRVTDAIQPKTGYFTCNVKRILTILYPPSPQTSFEKLDIKEIEAQNLINRQIFCEKRRNSENIPRITLIQSNTLSKSNSSEEFAKVAKLNNRQCRPCAGIEVNKINFQLKKSNILERRNKKIRNTKQILPLDFNLKMI